MNIFKINSKITLFLLLFLFYSSCAAALSRSYSIKATAHISKNDQSWAKQNALQLAQSQIILRAAQDLLEPYAFNKFHTNFSTYINKPKNYIQSFSILSEKVINTSLILSVSSVVDIPLLKSKLRQAGFILKTDPFFSVSFITTKNIPLDSNLFISHLKQYHIKSSLPQYVDQAFIQQNKTNLALTLFKKFPKHNILYFLFPVIKDNKITNLQFTVYLKSYYKTVTSLHLPISSNGQENLPFYVSTLLNSLNYSSLRIQEYKKNTANLTLSIVGLTSPFLRSQFEKYLLKSLSSIKNFTLSQLSENNTNYHLTSLYSLHKIILYLQRRQSRIPFLITVKNSSPTSATLQVQYKRRLHQVTAVQPWSYPLPFRKLSQEEIATIEQRPSVQEKEPNNTPFRFNLLVANTWLWGNVQSRADYDIYQIKLPNNRNNTKLSIQFHQLGATKLSPIIYLYQDNFSLLQQERLTSSNGKFTLTHQFLTLPSSIYFRVGDYIGYIPRESGGFLSFQYLVSYNWTH